MLTLLTHEEVLLERVSASRERPLLEGDAAVRLSRLLAARRDHYASFTERIPHKTRNSSHPQIAR